MVNQWRRRMDLDSFFIVVYESGGGSGGGIVRVGTRLFKCELRHDLFYVDNTEQVRGVLLGHA